jgi:hypothetical protein
MPHKWLDTNKTKIEYKPDWKPGVVWGQELGDPECPYLKRWVLNAGIFAIRLHHWMGSDDPRTLHDHAWGFWTFVLKGGYTDISEPFPADPSDPDRQAHRVHQHLGRFSLKYRPAHHKHTVQTDPGGAWTLLLNGRHIRTWGFYPDGKFMKVREYFRKFGHHPCIDEEPK